MKIKINTLLMAAAFAASMSMTAFAGTWQQDTNGWWYQNDNGSYLNNGWCWIDGRCYYFMPDGYCLTDTTTPDGYTVNTNGAWTINGVVQIQKTIDYSKWSGRYAADDGQIITVNSADENSVSILFKGYSEEGWYTESYQLFYSNEAKTEAIYEYSNGSRLTTKIIYTLTDVGIEVTMPPYGGWAEGIYIRQ